MTSESKVVRLLKANKHLVMGILNITPDSFSDGGCFLDVDEAVAQAQRMVGEGADIIDIGGESTRPGAGKVNTEVQISRIVPVICALRRILPKEILLSVDTSSSVVAKSALLAGVDFVNDVSAGLDDVDMFPLVIEHNVPLVLMHMQGSPSTMQDNPYYDDVVAEVLSFLLARANAAVQAGVPKENIIIDPGIGFGKRRDDNLRLLAGLECLTGLDYPVLIGTSRKRFMGQVCGEMRPSELLGATIATTVLGMAAGVRIFRVHDVKENRQALDVASAIFSFRQPASQCGLPPE